MKDEHDTTVAIINGSNAVYSDAEGCVEFEVDWRKREISRPIQDLRRLLNVWGPFANIQMDVASFEALKHHPDIVMERETHTGHRIMQPFSEWLQRHLAEWGVESVEMVRQGTIDVCPEGGDE